MSTLSEIPTKELRKELYNRTVHAVSDALVEVFGGKYADVIASLHTTDLITVADYEQEEHQKFLDDCVKFGRSIGLVPLWLWKNMDPTTITFNADLSEYGIVKNKTYIVVENGLTVKVKGRKPKRYNIVILANTWFPVPDVEVSKHYKIHYPGTKYIIPDQAQRL